MTSGAGGKATDRDITAQADIEQPAAVVMTPRGSITQPQKRHSSGGVSKAATLAGSLTAMLGESNPPISVSAKTVLCIPC